MGNKSSKSVNYDNIPTDLTDCPFYGLNLDDDQKKFRDALWDESKRIVFCNSKAGTGKTTISVGVANLLYQYGLYKEIDYIVSPTQELKQGYLPGDITDKSEPYMEPLYEALLAINLNPNQVIINDDTPNKSGIAFVRPMVHTFLRGTNFDHSVVIIEEAQNYYKDELKKVLTRMHDSCKVIVIGHSLQCDLYKNPNNSGFIPYMNHFISTNDSRVAICKLNTNHRGWISTTADQLL